MNDVDRLKIYRGGDIVIDENIKIHVPTLNEICDVGEKKYYSFVYSFCSTPNDLCFQLYKLGIDFTEITDYDLFFLILHKSFDKKDSQLIFGDKIDFSQMKSEKNEDTNELILVQEKYELHNRFLDFIYKHLNIKPFLRKFPQKVKFTKKMYLEVTDMLREMHGFKKDTVVPGNESTKMAMIEDARDEFLARNMEPSKSVLLPTISALVNMEGFKRNDKEVFDMNIYTFMDCTKRILKIKNIDLLLQSGYSGFGIDLKKIKQSDLNYMGELN